MHMKIVCGWVVKSLQIKVFGQPRNGIFLMYTTPKVYSTKSQSSKSWVFKLFNREKLKESFKIIISGSEPDTQKFIAEAKSEFKKLRPEELAFPRGITEIKKYADRRTVYKKGTPIHCRGSLLYNKMVKDLGLTKKYELIQGGDKVKFVYLKLPNILRENVIAFKDYLPPEFNLENNIDYDTQFDKVFNKPLEPILSAVNWTAEESINFEDMFG